jgi:hypothetical protein
MATKMIPTMNKERNTVVVHFGVDNYIYYTTELFKVVQILSLYLKLASLLDPFCLAKIGSFVLRAIYYFLTYDI